MPNPHSSFLPNIIRMKNNLRPNADTFLGFFSLAHPCTIIRVNKKNHFPAFHCYAFQAQYKSGSSLDQINYSLWAKAKQVEDNLPNRSMEQNFIGNVKHFPNNVDDFLLFLRRVSYAGPPFSFCYYFPSSKVRQPVVKPLCEHHMVFCKEERFTLSLIKVYLPAIWLQLILEYGSCFFYMVWIKKTV